MSNIIKKRFDSGCPSWEKEVKFNEYFLKAQQNYFTEMMQAQGFVFLRDVYMGLGLATTKESCILGWVKGVVKEKDYVNFSYSQIEDTSDFELIFECYPILDYLEMENVAG